jgi:hypothetical protein
MGRNMLFPGSNTTKNSEREENLPFRKKDIHAGAMRIVTKYRTSRNSGPYKSAVPPFIII